MRKYKLLYFVSEDEYFLSHKIDQAKYALKKNYEVLVLCKFSESENIIKSQGFKTENINIDRKSLNPLKEIFCLFKLLKITFDYKPDIIQSVALKPILYTSIISLFLKKTQLILCVVGLGYLFINKTFKTKILKNIFLKLINLFLIKNKVLFIFQNKDDEQTLKKYNITKHTKTTIIEGSGVDTKKFIFKKKRKIYDLIFHSRILYDKGILELIDAIKILKEKRKLSVLILGNPDPSNRASITTEKLKKWEKEKLIIWKQKEKNVIPFLQKSKIAVLPSYREGLPKTLLEAASCGLPIVTSNVEGCKEVCLDNFNGILVPPRDHVSLSIAIEKILTNPKLAKFYGDNGRKLIQKRFSIEIIKKEFLKVYNESLE